MPVGSYIVQEGYAGSVSAFRCDTGVEARVHFAEMEDDYSIRAYLI